MDFGVMNVGSKLTSTESLELVGIEAHDVSSLLEQFEEASQSSEDIRQPCTTNTVTSIPERKDAERKPAPVKKACATNYAFEKLKSGTKRKGAILLPMGVPSGRGRGQAVAIPAHCSSPKLQKILHKTSMLAQQKPLPSDVAVKTSTSPSNSSSDTEVSNSYYDNITDHDYCQNFPHSVSPPTTSEQKTDEEANPAQNVVLSSKVQDTSTAEILQLHDPESSVFDVTFKKCSTDQKVTLKEKFRNLKRKITHKEYKHRHRNYRKKEEGLVFPEDSGQFFDKIPSYYTTLSLPTKPPKKDQRNDKDQPKCGMHVTDFIQREISPSVSSHSEVYNKLPAYHNCFINSTKYDSSSASNSVSMVEAVKLENAKYPWDRLRDNLNRENPGSRSQSPLLMLESRYESKSREISRSRSSSRHSSRSWSSSRSPSSHGSRSRSRSRGRSRRHSRRRQKRRERGHSYSSYSSVSSDSDWSYCSRSRSCSRDRYYSRSCSRGSSRSHSRSPSRHRHKSRRNPSYERRREERQKLRADEKKRQIEERRIVYVGKIPDTFTRKQLRARFERFGEIEETSVHFRESGDNYGFVTFAYTCDAYAAIEHGNKVAGEQPFDLCFGGRREFCSTDYADLDGQVEEEEECYSMTRKSSVLDFDQLLNEARRKLKK